MSNVETIVKEILRKYIGNTNSVENMKLEDNLVDLGLSSINYIKIIVEIENEFDFEFSDDELGLNIFKTVKDLINYIEQKINS